MSHSLKMISRLPLYLLVLVTNFTSSVEAYTVFHTNCTLPTQEFNFVESPNGRGTLDILWSSLFTIFACTWSVLHLNVPEQRLDKYPNWTGYLRWKSKILWTNSKWMLITVLAPELLLSQGMTDLVNAKDMIRLMSPFAEEDDITWTTTHSLFASMGGFVISYGGTATVPPIADPEAAQKGQRLPNAEIENRMDSSLKTQSEGLSVESLWTEDDVKQIQTYMRFRKSQQNYLHLTAKEIFTLRKKGVLQKLPAISEEEIKDKSKSDAFAKAIAVGQILWNVLQIVARAAQHLPSSQLEIAVMAFSACAAIIYGVNWSKPKSAQVPCILLRYNGDIPSQVIYELESLCLSKWMTIYSDEDQRSRLRSIERRLSSSPIPNNSIPSKLPHRTTTLPVRTFGFSLIGISIMFGSLHMIAWNFAFPTHIEQLLWRIASLCITATMPLWLLLTLILCLLSQTLFDRYQRRVLIPAAILLYTIARLYLLVEMFRTLAFLPPDAYIPTWPGSIPHFS